MPAKVDESRLADLDAQYGQCPGALSAHAGAPPRLVTCGGQVVFINSSAGINARAGVSQYAATKHALRASQTAFATR